MNAPKKTALIGSGGHARSLMEFAAAAIDGYIDKRPSEGDEIPYLGNDEEFIASNSPEQWLVHMAIVGGSGKDMPLRRKIIERFIGAGFRFATLTAPTAIVTPSARIGEGCALLHRCVINGATLGSNCVVNTGAIVEHACRIADNVFIGPGAVICGEVTIGSDTFIGAGATVRNCVTIGTGVTIGAGACVVADITEPGVYAGCPAKLIDKKP